MTVLSTSTETSEYCLIITADTHVATSLHSLFKLYYSNSWYLWVHFGAKEPLERPRPG